MASEGVSSGAVASFRAVSYPLRLYAGIDALDNLPAELDRQAVQRAFVICGNSVANRTNLRGRVAVRLGERYAGAFDRMDKDSSYAAVVAATEAARDARADLLIAVGGGSTIVGARVTAILLAESGDPYALKTQYPAGKPAVSPRLLAPKLPIINIPTTPTTAMNRAGSGLKNPRLDHRMEFFDPKTRPVALIWDTEALLTAPLPLARSAGTTTFTAALHAAASPSLNPLTDGDYQQAYRLARRALPRLVAEPGDASARLDLCASAFLINRAADDGAAGGRDRVAAAAYALATALHNRYEHLGQGEATAAVTPGVVRSLANELGRSMSALLDPASGHAGSGKGSLADAASAAAALVDFYRSVGMPFRVRDLGIPQSDLGLVARDTLKNFNANPGERPPDYVAQMEALLQACW